MSRIIKPVAFSEGRKDQELLNFAEAQGQFATYVKRLIDEDRKKNYVNKEEIKKLIVEVIKELRLNPEEAKAAPSVNSKLKGSIETLKNKRG